MHVTTKEIVADKESRAKYPDLNDGTHILTSVVEADGPVALCSADAKLEARVISIQRTDSGGVKVQVALNITEPAPTVAPVALAPKDQASAYLAGKGMNTAEIAKAIETFGVDRILAREAAEKDQAAKALDEQLNKLLS